MAVDGDDSPKKRKSGAQYRAEARAREAEIARAASLAAQVGGEFIPKGNPLAKAAARFAGDAAAEFAKLGPPPTDADTALTWARQHVILALHMVATDPNPEIDSLTRARMIKELADTVGKTHNRGALEERIERLQKKQADRADLSGGVDKFDAGSIARPPTSRPRGAGSGPGKIS